VRLFNLLACACVATVMGPAPQARAQFSDNAIRIGFLGDLSGPYADADGPGSAEAIRMAIEDAGGSINGHKIELMTADHQNRGNVASAKAREWFDQQHLDLLIGGGASSATLAMAQVANDKRRVYIAAGTASERLTNEDCTPYSIHYIYDTVALSRGTASAVVADGGKSWFFLTADYTFGHSLEDTARKVIVEAGGKVVGSARAPLNTSDFSSYILQAQSSGAQIMGLANAGADTINAIKTAKEFNLNRTMSMAGLLVFLTDIHSLGLDLVQNMYMTVGWYWDQDEASRSWAKRYHAAMGKMPTMAQAGSYSATRHYLAALKALGTDDADKAMAWMKATPINDMFTQSGRIRPDGRMVYDMYLMRVKPPAESRYPWDYLKRVRTMKGDDIYTKQQESRCTLWKKS